MKNSKISNQFTWKVTKYLNGNKIYPYKLIRIHSFAVKGGNDVIEFVEGEGFV